MAEHAGGQSTGRQLRPRLLLHLAAPPQVFECLAPAEAASLLSVKALAIMTPEQLRALPPAVVAALSEEQLAALHPGQLAALSREHLAALSPEQLLTITGGLAGDRPSGEGSAAGKLWVPSSGWQRCSEGGVSWRRMGVR